MIEFLEFTFGSFLHFVGVLVLICVPLSIFCEAFGRR
jgi:hypothetical protein